MYQKARSESRAQSCMFAFITLEPPPKNCSLVDLLPRFLIAQRGSKRLALLGSRVWLMHARNEEQRKRLEALSWMDRSPIADAFRAFERCCEVAPQRRASHH